KPHISQHVVRATTCREQRSQTARASAWSQPFESKNWRTPVDKRPHANIRGSELAHSELRWRRERHDNTRLKSTRVTSGGLYGHDHRQFAGVGFSGDSFSV